MMHKDLERAVASMRRGLELQLGLVDARMEKARSTLVHVPRRDDLVHRSESPEYISAKRDYEEASAVLQHKKLAQRTRRISTRMDRHPVTIHEKPKIGRSPVSPNVPVYLVTGAMGGAVGGLLLGVFIGVILKVGRRK